ncbi:hypothetical protein [Niabella hibiscisoli]|uniref:hypothetical protein n=1 Tax=Niabella hibiscisoli TaxID=1825928 RepID=UPI001F0E1102|nr:hypothetical protein [Niabella hibiscisoli]MCH5715763.1 hypothetical protein [Niabella hibiscisoli]
MWEKLGKAIIKYRFVLLILLTAVTALFAYWGSKAELGYEFTRAIPTDHPVNIAYQEFKKKYGQDGNLMVVGVQTDQFFTEKVFNSYVSLQHNLKKYREFLTLLQSPAL